MGWLSGRSRDRASVPVDPGARPPAASRPQDRIGPFAVRGIIGAGAMGTVYLAHDARIDRLVALKTIRPELLQAEHDGHSIADRFRLEAKISGRLSHRNIVSVYQFGEDPECAWLAMEYVAGRSLRDYLARPGGLSLPEILSLMVQLLDALGYAHGCGVVHRDVKPANLIIDHEGRLKVTDFGIARIASSQLTRGNAIVGSPGYMAPEQYLGNMVDGRADVFAAGVLLFELLSGSTPFPGPEQALMFQVLYEPHRSLVSLVDDPGMAPFDRLIEHALAKDPGRRLASAAEFRDLLLAVAGQPVADRLRAERLLPPAALGHALDLPETMPRPVAPVPPRRPAPTTPEAEVGPTNGNGHAEQVRLERDFALHVGPIARVLVQRALRDGHDTHSARVALAATLEDATARRRLLVPSGTGPAALQREASGHRPAKDVPAATPLAESDTAHAVAALLPWLGPVARVVVRRVAATASTREALVAGVLGQLAPELNRARVESDLWQALR